MSVLQVAFRTVAEEVRKQWDRERVHVRRAQLCCKGDVPCLLWIQSPLALQESQFHPDRERGGDEHAYIGGWMRYGQKKRKKKRKPLGGNEMFHFSKYKLLFFFFKQTILISSLHFMNIHTQRVLFTGLANYSMWCQYVLWKALLQFATPHVLQAVPAQNKWVIMSNCSNYKCKVRSIGLFVQ